MSAGSAGGRGEAAGPAAAGITGQAGAGGMAGGLSGEWKAFQGRGSSELQSQMESSVLSCAIVFKANLCSRRGKKASRYCFPKRSICISRMTFCILYK